MPRMDGLTFLKKLMASFPLPVVIVSSFTPAGCALSLEALESGAVDVIGKPASAAEQQNKTFTDTLADKVKAASQARFRKAAPAKEKPRAKVHIPRVTDKVVVIGASTGGTEALREFLARMPEDCPGIAIVQHMPENFTGAFASRLNSQCTIEVREAEDGMEVIPGRAIIARGSHHLVLERIGSHYRVGVKGGPLVCRHRPSVEVLFNSAAKSAGDKAVGIIMTGMGADGAQGMKNLRDTGAHTIAQDEASCVVFGMPKEAIKLGAAETVAPLDRIPEALFSYL